jgi:hypothetical protein
MNILTAFGLPLAEILALIVSVIIPALSALLARSHWSDNAVGLLTLLLATANGFFSQWAAAGDGFNWKKAVGLSLVSYGIAVLAHYGLIKGDTYAKLKATGSKRRPAL